MVRNDRRPDPADLADRLDALHEVLALARERVDEQVVVEAERVAARAGERLRFGQAHTVVALAGATGSGKSSLFNDLAGASLSQVGARRPTTAVAHAAVWGSQDAGALLDWLEVTRRHVRPAPDEQQAWGIDRDLDGLVLLDLPDVDSVQQRHRLEADRLVARVDLLIWVLDPQKYADAAVHQRYLAPLAEHADVMLVVLNQVDLLSRPARAGCMADLGRLLGSEGLEAVPVLSASARTGEGLDQLRAELARRVSAKRSSMRRLEADLSALAAGLDHSCAGPRSNGVRPADQKSLVTALSDAAGADAVADAVAGSYRLRARRDTGWPLTRWTSRLRLDPARRLRLRDTPSELVRTSLPVPSAVQRARVDTALRELSDRAAAGLSDPWPSVVRRAAVRSRAELPELLDRAVAGTDLELGRRPRWWRVVGAAQSLLLASATVGLLWLLALFVVAWLQLPAPPLPRWGRFPVPTLILLLGLVFGFLLAWISGLFARVGARRRAQRARRRLDERVKQVSDEAVVRPVEHELAAYLQWCDALRRLHG